MFDKLKSRMHHAKVKKEAKKLEQFKEERDVKKEAEFEVFSRELTPQERADFEAYKQAQEQKKKERLDKILSNLNKDGKPSAFNESINNSMERDRALLRGWGDNLLSRGNTKKGMTDKRFFKSLGVR